MSEASWVKSVATIRSADPTMNHIQVRRLGDGDVVLDIWTHEGLPITSNDDTFDGGVEFCASGSRGRDHTISTLSRLIAAANNQDAHPELPLWSNAEARILDDMHYGRRFLCVRMTHDTVSIVIEECGKVITNDDGRAVAHLSGMPSQVMMAFRNLVIAMQIDQKENL